MAFGRPKGAQHNSQSVKVASKLPHHYPLGALQRHRGWRCLGRKYKRKKRKGQVARRCTCALLLALAPLGAGSLTRARGLGRCKWRALPRPVQGRRPDLRRWGAAASNGARSRARSRGAALVPGAGALRPLLPLRQWRCTAAPSVTSVVALCPLDPCSQNYNVATVGRCSCCCPVALASLVAGATRRASRDACVTTYFRFTSRRSVRYGCTL